MCINKDNTTENIVNKSETTTKRDVDEWVDGEGKFHRRIIEETIKGPMDLNETILPRRQKRNRIPNSPRPKFWNPMYPKFQDPTDYLSFPEVLNSFRDFNERERRRFENMDTSKDMNTSKEESEKRYLEKPVIDIKEFIDKVREILSGLGVDVEKEIKKFFTKSKEGTKTNFEKEETLNQKKEVKTWQKNKKQKPKKQNQKKKKK